MTAEEDLINIEAEIVRLNKEDEAILLEEAMLNAQIESIRLQLARVKDKRYAVKTRKKTVYLDKESAERKLELEKESAALDASVVARREEAMTRINSAPWKDTAFPWQIEGALRLPERALLADKRGLGKTLSSIIWRRVHNVKRTLVCLRKEVAYDFIKELNLREPGVIVYPLVGVSTAERNMAAQLLGHHEEFIVVTNIESWRMNTAGVTEDILKIKYDGVILDEAHHIKSSEKATAQGFFRLAEGIPKVLELTGTPIKNRPQEMYALLHALYPDLFPRERKFLFDYCFRLGQNKWVFSPEGVKNLVQKISSFYLARTPEDIGRVIPPPRMIEYKLDFSAHKAQHRAYREATEMAMAILSSGKAIPIVSQLAIMTRQAQMVSWPAGINFQDPETGESVRFDVHESVKMDWAEDLLKDLCDEGERTVFFSRFKPAIYELKQRLVAAGLSVAVITGDEKDNAKEIFDDFDLKMQSPDREPKYQILLATYQTVGESANLNAATQMVLYDRFWNPGNEDQAIGRVDRINSTRQATVHIPLVDDSIDQYMTKLIEDKRNLVAEFRDASQMQESLMDHLKGTL